MSLNLYKYHRKNVLVLSHRILETKLVINQIIFLVKIVKCCVEVNNCTIVYILLTNGSLIKLLIDGILCHA